MTYNFSCIPTTLWLVFRCLIASSIIFHQKICTIWNSLKIKRRWLSTMRKCLGHKIGGQHLYWIDDHLWFIMSIMHHMAWDNLILYLSYFTPTWTHTVLESLHLQPGPIFPYCTWVTVSPTWTHTVLESLHLQPGPILHLSYCLSNMDPYYTWVTVSPTWNHDVLESLSLQPGPILYLSHCPSNLDPYCTWVIVSPTWRTHTVLE